MSYIQGFVTAVPSSKKDAYIEHAAAAAALFKELGASRIVETWGDDVPPGQLTDFRRAVQATDDETVVLSWIEFSDKATRDAVWAKLESDPRLHEIGATAPFDGKRMIFGGFEIVLDR